jgi:hypothetical protein
MDVLHEDLSHLTGESICGLYPSGTQANAEKRNHRVKLKPDLVSIEYLLDILRCIHEWVSSKCEPSSADNLVSNEKSSLGPKKKSQTGTSLKSTTNQPQRNVPHEVKEKTDQDDYLNDVSKTAENINELIDLVNLKLSDQLHDIKAMADSKTAGADIILNQNKNENDDTFREYMRCKEREYLQNKLIQSSSSGNSSLASSHSSLSSTYVELKLNSKKPKTLNSNNQQQQEKVIRLEKFRSLSTSVDSHLQTVENELGSIRVNINKHKENESGKIKNMLNGIFQDDLKDTEYLMSIGLNKLNRQETITNQLFENAYSKPLYSASTSSISTTRKTARSKARAVLIPTCRALNSHRSLKRSSSTNSLDQGNRVRRSASVANHHTSRSSTSSNPSSRFLFGDDGFLRVLLDEFPHLYTAPETVHYLWQRHAKQIEKLTKEQKEIESKYLNKQPHLETQVQAHLSQVYNKHKMLMEIMRKELAHTQRMEDMKLRKQVENSMKSREREQRFQNAKSKRYYEEFVLQQRAKMMKQATSEELVFKKLFNETLKIQKERLLDLKKYAKEKSELSSKQQMDQIESIENYYKNRFDLLSERVQREKQDTETKIKAQHCALNKKKNQVKQKLETDIRDLQEQLYRDKDFLFWREMDANKLKKEIRKASYYKLT